MRKQNYTDFSAVPEHQRAIHARLENWGRWCFGAGHSNQSPMFRMYRSSEVWHTQYMANSTQPVDTEDARLIAKAVVALPENNRHATNWFYVRRCSPKWACRIIGCNPDSLAAYVINGRQLMIEAKV